MRLLKILALVGLVAAAACSYVAYRAHQLARAPYKGYAEDEIFFTVIRGAALSVQRYECDSGRLDALFEAPRLYTPSLSFSPRTRELLLATSHQGSADLDLVDSLELVAAR